MWISRYRYSYMMEEKACLHAHFGYIWCHFLLLDGPHIPPITIEAHTTYCIPLIVFLGATLTMLSLTMPTWDLSGQTTHCDLCDTSLGMMQMVRPLDLPFVRIRLLKSIRMWEILSMIMISHHPRSLSIKVSMVQRYPREKWFRLTRNRIPQEMRVTLLRNR